MVNIATIIKIINPIFSIGIKIDKIRRMNVNTTKNPAMNLTKSMNPGIDNIVVPNKTNTHKTIKNIKTTRSKVVLDNFFNPLMNLILCTPSIIRILIV